LRPLTGDTRASWRADARRFRHERRLKASDDTIAVLDQVGALLEDLRRKVAAMHLTVMERGGDDPDVLWSQIGEVEDSYQVTRIAIARLSMRPSAQPALLEAARDASKALHGAAGHARRAQRQHQFQGGESDQTKEWFDWVRQDIEEADTATALFYASSQRALGAMVGA
jgi:hypothetical protein